MAVTLTTEEESFVKYQRRFDFRPFYYSASQFKSIQIDEDYEAYLILQTVDLKQKVLTWITEALDAESDNTDRDDLLNLFLNEREADCTATVDEVDNTLDTYTDMQKDLITDGEDSTRWAELDTVNVMSFSLSRPVDKILLVKERAFHERNMVLNQRKVLELNQSNEDTQQELESWQTVVSSYKGKQSSGGSF